MKKKLRVLLVAPVVPPRNGHVGGQLTAALTLYTSALAGIVEFNPVVNKKISVPPPSLPVRAVDALRRLFQFISQLLRSDVVLVFSQDGLGLIEKGLMCIVARIARRGVIIRFGSGLIDRQCRHPLMKLWLRLVLRSAHVICSQGPFWTSYFQNFAEAQGKVIEIPNGINLESVDSRLPGHARGHRLIYVGAVKHSKGVFEMLDVLEAVRETYPQTTLSVVGGGDDFEEFKAAVKRRGMQAHVSAEGWASRDEVKASLSMADVFLFPSHYEGLPNAVLEAMAAAVPVVATRVGSIPDLIRDGSTGFLADVGDTRAMTRGVLALMSEPDEASRIGLNGRRLIEEKYDINKIWLLYAEALKKAAREVGCQRGAALMEHKSPLEVSSIQGH
ncbi:MAG TPA: glycosyltransferase family 4 protein [Pyrinomonadaceae bacterium]|nr:glycosyltransferase family 4 protein [Pyrinomonadaceae bacterium]